MNTMRIKTILVPVDFSELSKGAVEAAQSLATNLGAALHLVHVHRYPYLFEYMEAAVPVPHSVESFSQQGWEEVADKLRDLGGRYGVPGEHCYLQEGSQPFSLICQVAQEIRADLIVLPTHGHTGLKHLFLGSTAEQVVRHAPCPVWVYRPSRRGLQRILAPTDFSACSAEALRHALELGDQLGAEVSVLHVMPFGLADAYFTKGVTLPSALQEQAGEQMRLFMEGIDSKGKDIKTVIRPGSSAHTICQHAESEGFDLIVTGTHGWSGLERLLIGSTAEHVVRRAHVPVLVVPSHPAVRSDQLKGAKTLSKTPVGKAVPA